MKRKIIIIVGIMIVLAWLVLCSFTAQTGSVNGIDNTKIEWGFVRAKNNQQPEFTKKYTDVLNKYDGIYIGNNENNYVYLTFDLGYENGYTNKILDTLADKNVKAAFFATGDYVKRNGEIVLRIINDGHILGNHSENHPSMPELANEEKVKNEITKLHNTVKENYGYNMVFFRPPKGEYSEYTMQQTQKLGYKTVMWSFAYDDWDVKKQKGAEYAKSKIIDNVHPGEIMLLHAVSKDNANVLGDVIDEIQSKGYVFKTLDDFAR